MSEPVPLSLREFHESLGANFATLNGVEIVSRYDDVAREYRALQEFAGVLDLSFRSRVCLTGADRVRFLHGQVTNDVKKLRVGEGCYSALTTAKGKMQSDLNIFCLQDELLLDFEPGLTALVNERLGKYIIADDVQVVDVAPHYGLLSVQGPQAEAVVRSLELFPALPTTALSFKKIADATRGEIYLMQQARLGTVGFDLFVPVPALGAVLEQLIAGAKIIGGCACGWEALEIARIEAGIPRFGVDMDETHLASECGIESRAISYTKGCYIGQEVLNRIHSMGRVNRELRRLRFDAGLKIVPAPGAKLFHGPQEAGCITSATFSARQGGVMALGYVRRESAAVGTKLGLSPDAIDSHCAIVG